MHTLHTKNGRPLQLVGDRLFAKSGSYLGLVKNGKAYHSTGIYAGTIVGDRVVYRLEHSATLIGPSVHAPWTPSVALNQMASFTLGDEPTFKD